MYDKKSAIALCGSKGESFMPCTEAYREHVMYTFNDYYKIVMHIAAINVWYESRRWQKDIQSKSWYSHNK